MTEVTEFTISRAVWLRATEKDGQIQDASYLLQPVSIGDKQCCVGIYLEACGVPRNRLRGMKAAHQLTVTECPSWLREESRHAASATALNLYTTNDGDGNEAKIAGYFADQGITVTFTD